MNKLPKSRKPLATRGGGSLFPICFVDDDSDPPPTQSAVAAVQWGKTEPEITGKEWLKSWYFPLDCFDPWPSKTSLSCWWCTHGFSWSPFPLPYQYDVYSNRYRAVGVFCGPSCAKSYACRSKCYANLDDVLRFIEIVARDFYGYERGSVIPMAPDKEVLQRYCGPNGLTIDQFRNACRCGRSIMLLDPMWITVKQVVQAEQQTARMRRVVFHSENPDDIQRTRDLVRMKRIPFAGLGARRLSDYK